jgi:hypothetical protein
MGPQQLIQLDQTQQRCDILQHKSVSFSPHPFSPPSLPLLSPFSTPVLSIRVKTVLD